MTEIKDYKGKSCIEANVLLIPTMDRSNILKTQSGQIMVAPYKSEWTVGGSSDGQRQHIHFTSGQKIKEGDICLNLYGPGTVFKITKVLIECFGYDDYKSQDTEDGAYFGKVKVAPDNTITIHPVKELSDVEKILEYMSQNNYNATNPVLYSYVSSFIK